MAAQILPSWGPKKMPVCAVLANLSILACTMVGIFKYFGPLEGGKGGGGSRIASGYPPCSHAYLVGATCLSSCTLCPLCHIPPGAT